MRAHWPVLIVDPKHGYQNFAEAPEQATLEHPWKIENPGGLHMGAPVCIYQPVMPARHDAMLDVIFFHLLEVGYWVVEIEDTAGMMNAQQAPEGYMAIITQGRAKQVSVLTLAQRPIGVPDVAMSQADHIIVFRQLGAGNVKRMVDFTQDPSMAYPLHKYQFRYWNEEMDKSRKFAPLRREDVHGRDVEKKQVTQ